MSVSPKKPLETIVCLDPLDEASKAKGISFFKENNKIIAKIGERSFEVEIIRTTKGTSTRVTWDILDNPANSTMKNVAMKVCTFMQEHTLLPTKAATSSIKLGFDLAKKSANILDLSVDGSPKQKTEIEQYEKSVSATALKTEYAKSVGQDLVLTPSKSSPAIKPESSKKEMDLSIDGSPKKSASATASKIEHPKRIKKDPVLNPSKSSSAVKSDSSKKEAAKKKEDIAPVVKKKIQPKDNKPSTIDKTSLTKHSREHRVRDEDTFTIMGRLKKAFTHAQIQMDEQEDNSSFKYAEAPKGPQLTLKDGTTQRALTTETGVVGGYPVGITHFQGDRPTMEDEHIATHFQVTIAGKIYPVSLFGIFDGHNGDQAAKYVKKHLQRKLTEALQRHNPKELTYAGVFNALKLTCVELHDAFVKENGKKMDAKGKLIVDHVTTATFSMILDNQLWTANVGDSRTILNNGGTPIQLSKDAKPDDPDFRRGIENRDGTVAWGRINGNLACGRAIGDFSLNGANSARPKITMIPLSQVKPNSKLILGCDGVFDVASTHQIVDMSKDRDKDPAELSRDLVYSAYRAWPYERTRGIVSDNISMLVVSLTG